MSIDKTEFQEIAGITFEAAQRLAGDSGAKGAKQLATLEWLQEIITLEAIEREIATIEEQTQDGERMEAAAFRDAWRLMADRAQASFRTARQYAETMAPAGGGWFDRRGIEERLFHDVTECAKNQAYDRAYFIAGHIDTLAAVEIMQEIQATDSGTPAPESLLMLAALVDRLPEVPPDATASEEFLFWQSVEGMTAPELEAERKRLEAELAGLKKQVAREKRIAEALEAANVKE